MLPYWYLLARRSLSANAWPMLAEQLTGEPVTSPMAVRTWPASCVIMKSARTFCLRGGLVAQSYHSTLPAVTSFVTTQDRCCPQPMLTPAGLQGYSQDVINNDQKAVADWI